MSDRKKSGRGVKHGFSLKPEILITVVKVTFRALPRPRKQTASPFRKKGKVFRPADDVPRQVFGKNVVAAGGGVMDPPLGDK
jgi:hypothetical protein